MSTPRFWLGFTLLAVWLFGLLGYGCYLIATWHPGTALAVTVLVFISGKVLPRPVAWLVSLGARR